MKKNDFCKLIVGYPLTVCFSLFILVIFAMYFFMPDKELSEWENRYLAKAPEVRIGDLMDGSYMTKYENYINDQIPFRDGFIKLKAIGETCILKIENNGISKGKDSYLFTKGEEKTDIFDKNIAIISQFSEAVNNNVTVAIAPNASGVLMDKIPKGMIMPDQSEKLMEISGNNSLLKGARVVDLRSALLAHEDEYIYYKTDHHWTTLGAYYAYREISDNPVKIEDIEKDVKQETSEGFLGTLYAKYKGLFVDSDVINFYDIPVKEFITDETERDSLLDREKLKVFDKYGMFLFGNFGESKIVSDDSIVKEEGRNRSLIVFKDSYANCLIPFLTYDYEYITLIDLRYYKGSVKELIASNSDADILFINNFDFLNEDNHFYKMMK